MHLDLIRKCVPVVAAFSDLLWAIPPTRDTVTTRIQLTIFFPLGVGLVSKTKITQVCLVMMKQHQIEVVGVSLSEPNTSMTALHTHVCIYACLLACLDRPLK